MKKIIFTALVAAFATTSFAQDIVKQIREGDYTMYSDSGGSVHGKAIYFGTDFRTASSYAQSGMNARNPIVMRAKLTGGKTISESKARSDYQSALRKGEKLALACSNAGYDSAVNLYTPDRTVTA